MRKAVFIITAVIVLFLIALLLYRMAVRRPSSPAGEGETTRTLPPVEGEKPPVIVEEKAPSGGPPTLTEEERRGAKEISLLRATSLVRSQELESAEAVAGFIGGLQPAEIRWEAARAAAAEGTDAMAVPLAGLFREGEPRARIMAAYAMKGVYDRTGEEMLGRTLEEEAAPLLSEMAQTYLDPQIKRDSWSTLGYVDPESALQAYRRQGEMPYALEERAVLSIGMNGGDGEAEGAIAMFEEATTAGKKVAACRIVGLIGTRRRGGPAEKFMAEKGLAFIREAASGREGDPRVRRAAVAALGESGGGECLTLLQEVAREYPREAGRAIEQIRSRASAQ